MINNPKLQLLIDNFFISFHGQNIFCHVADIDNNIVFINDYFDKQQSSINSKNIQGMSIREFFIAQNPEYSISCINEIEHLYQDTLSQRQRKTFLAYAKDLNNNDYVQQSNTFPIISNDDELLGSYTLSGFANPFNFLINFISDFPDKQSIEFIKHIPKLGRREHQVLFLLINRFSQYEIANFLSISRTTVQKIITNGLMPKFNIITNEQNDLITRAIKLHLHMYFPPSLLQNRLITIDNNESIIRQIANQINQR